VGDDQRVTAPTPLRTINSVAPIRVCDNGGWTDTWFAEHGSIFNIGVYPYVEVQVDVYRRDERADPITLFAENYGERYAILPGSPLPDRHPLLEAAIDELGVPDDRAVDISIFSEAPAGCSTGTSAAVSVALIGALDTLTPGRLAPHEVARAAHRIEVDRLGLQSGIQDQLCSAFGGINFIEMFQYPYATVSQLKVPDSVWWELERRLVLVFLGRTHVSSAIHDRVIADLRDEGPSSPRLETLRRLAGASRDAVYAGDLDGLGDAMARNTAAQADLHPDLVSQDAALLIDVAKAHGAVGWKVNGAGGEGGSVTLLAGPSASGKRRLIAAVEEANPLFQVIPTYLSRFGLRVWEAHSH
jgi:D-glycero-alpha-D-manno-heptose-7-phosphate kinase